MNLSAAELERLAIVSDATIALLSADLQLQTLESCLRFGGMAKTDYEFERQSIELDTVAAIGVLRLHLESCASVESHIR